MRRSRREIALVDDIRKLPRSDAFETADDAIVQAYIDRTAVLATNGVATVPSVRDLKVAYTPMHGVGLGDRARGVRGGRFRGTGGGRRAAGPGPGVPDRRRSPTRRSPARWTSCSRWLRRRGGCRDRERPRRRSRGGGHPAPRRFVAPPDRQRGRRAPRLAGGRARESRRTAAARSPHPSCPRRRSAKWRAGATTSTSARPSPGSSGSPASVACCSATRRRSATSSTPTRCATRTASRRRSRCCRSRPS